MYGPYCGVKQAGAGADMDDTDGSEIPDLLLMALDDPYGKD